MQVTHGNKKCLNSMNVCYSVLQEVQYLQVQHKPVSRLSVSFHLSAARLLPSDWSSRGCRLVLLPTVYL